MCLFLLAIFSSVILCSINRQRWYGLHREGLGRRNDSDKRKRVVRGTSSLQRHSASVWNRKGHGVHDILVGQQNDQWDSGISKRDEGKKNKGEERLGSFLYSSPEATVPFSQRKRLVTSSRFIDCRSWYSGFNAQSQTFKRKWLLIVAKMNPHRDYA